MYLTNEHIKIASVIDAEVKRLISSDSDDSAILEAMIGHMADFKRVKDQSSQGGMDVLFQRFAGFHHYARILEVVVVGIESSEIKGSK